MRTNTLAVGLALTLVLGATAYAGRDSVDWMRWEQAIWAKQKGTSMPGQVEKVAPAVKEDVRSDAIALLKRVHPKNAYGY